MGGATGPSVRAESRAFSRNTRGVATGVMVEHAGEVALGAEAGVGGHVHQRGVAAGQQLLGALDALHQDVHVGRPAGGLFEHPCEMERAQVDRACQFLHPDRLRQVVGDELVHAPQLVRCQPAGDRGPPAGGARLQAGTCTASTMTSDSR